MTEVLHFQGYEGGGMLEKETSRYSSLTWLLWDWSRKDVWRSTGIIGKTVKTPFFGTYMGRNTFQAILSNLQVSDSTLDLPCNNRNYDSLYKVCPMLDMMDRTFVQSYKSGRDLSFDEGCCPYNDRVFFNVTTQKNPQNGIWKFLKFQIQGQVMWLLLMFMQGKIRLDVLWMLMFWTHNWHKLQKWLWVWWKREICWGGGTMFIWTTTIQVQIFFGSSIIRRCFPVGPAAKIKKICQKLSLKLYWRRKVIVYLEGMALC